MQLAAANRSRWLSGLGLGFSGAAVWAGLTFALSTYLNGESWRAVGLAIYGCIMAGYMTLVASLGLAPLGLVMGWQMPQRLAGLRPWPVFFLAGYVGVLAGALTAIGLLGLGTAQADWSAMRDTLGFYLLTLPPTFGLGTGLWAQQWRERLPHGYAAGWLYYDGACPFCLRWLGRLGFIARQGGFGLVPLQSEVARRDLGLAEGELPPEMKLRLADGRVLGGVDACIVLAEAAGWTAPLGWLARVPGFNQLAWRGYQWIAANRYCLAGQCKLPPQPERKLP